LCNAEDVVDSHNKYEAIERFEDKDVICPKTKVVLKSQEMTGGRNAST
jgi:hypothetical protein